MKKKILTAAVSLVAAGVILAACACTKEPTPPPKEPAKPVYTVDESVMADHTANEAMFAASAVTRVENSPLAGKTIYWLGSSVTYGASSEGESMAEFLAAKTGCISKKEAVSGTTIFDDNKTENTGVKSYTRRLVNTAEFDKTQKVDAFICQISTNDSMNDRLNKRGYMTASDLTDISLFDKSTTLGGVEYIIAYVLETWNCPIYFYSGSYFGDEGTRQNSNPKGSEYGRLVSQVKEIVQKWYDLGYEVGVIDMYNDSDFNAQVSDSYYSWCTSDPIHPRKAGYLNWWMPYFESYLINHICE